MLVTRGEGGTGKAKRAKGGQAYSDGRRRGFGRRDTTEYTDVVLWSCASETYVTSQCYPNTFNLKIRIYRPSPKIISDCTGQGEEISNRKLPLRWLEE